MTCPHYEGNRREGTCILKSEHYILSKETIEDYCKFNYQACRIFVEDVEKQLRAKVPEVEKRIQELEDAKKVSPGFLRKIVDGKNWVD